MIQKFCRVIVIASVIFVNTACVPKITEEEIKRLEQFDPAFKSILEKKKNVDIKVASLENQIALEKETLEARVSVLKDDFRKKKEVIQAQILQAKKELPPLRQAIKEKIEKVNQELKPKSDRLVSIEAMLKDTQSLLEKSKDTNIALQESAKWNTQIETLNKEKGKVEQEISSLKEKIRFYELGLRLIK
jgi:chromosome segregation ATPase